ncbi:hypothetical protein [Photorhabdus temperata]|uniref:Uncharacterized protein n=1 Tax=Photorhabdus temperata J3 TaxID=1389415 RepID=U7R618_PHOTE|nr:hypothetical protein [Photorhabdus temperata]EQB98044.1 hypothetical protein B738_27347 [Photorhabdus temperata subsp. temperata M1021]ERT15120.1 hypothetical protein O185_00040 [Photorhabdus temperata J3]
MLNKNKFEKVLERVINKNSNRCSMCKRPFSGPCHTFGGLDTDGKVQNVGPCCRSNIVDLQHGGVYTTTSVGTEEGERQARDLMASHPLSRRMM